MISSVSLIFTNPIYKNHQKLALAIESTGKAEQYTSDLITDLEAEIAGLKKEKIDQTMKVKKVEEFSDAIPQKINQANKISLNQLVKKPNRPQSIISRALIYVLLFSLFWAMSVVLSGYALSNGSNVLILGYQTFLSATICFFIYLQITKKQSQRRLKSRHIIYLIVLGGLAGGAGNYFGFEGIKYSAVNYGFLIKMTVVFVPILEFFILREIITYKRIFFIIILLFGAFLIITKGKLIIPVKEDIYTIVTALCFAMTNTFSKSLVRKNSPEYIALFRAIGGGVVLFIFAYLFSEDLIQKDNIWYAIIGGILVFLIFLFLYKALEIESATYVSMIGMSFSVFTAILSYFVLGQKLSYIQWLGASIIVLSVVLIEMKGSTLKLRRFWSIDKTIMIKK